MNARTLTFLAHWIVFGAGLILPVPSYSKADPPQESSIQAVPHSVPSADPNSFISSNPLEQALTGSREDPEELSDLTSESSTGISLTLEDSIRFAIHNATPVLTAKNNIEASGAQVLQGYGQFLPSVSLTSAYSYSTGTNYYAFGSPSLVNGTGTALGFNLSSTLNLFNGLADYANLQSVLLKKQADELTLTRAKQQIALDVAQSFLQVILDNKIVDIARKNLQESQAREKLLEAQTKLGARSLSDLFRQQAQTSSDESFVFNSKNKTRTDTLSLLTKLRADVTKRYHFIEPDLPDHTTEPSASASGENLTTNSKYMNEALLIQTGLQNRADLKAAVLTSTATHWDSKVSFSGYLPKLDLIGSAISGGRYLTTQIVNGVNVVPVSQTDLGYQLWTQINYTISVNLSWNLFDRFTTQQNWVKAKIIAENQDIYAQDRKTQVEGEVRTAYGSYQLSLQQLRASAKGLEAAQKAYAVMEGRYRVGAASFIDLVTVQAALVQAESARAQALIDYQLQIRTVEFAIGDKPVRSTEN